MKTIKINPDGPEREKIKEAIEELKKGDMVYAQSYALESGEKIEIDGKMRILIPDTAIAIVW